jgi:hypothetical protein
MGVPLLLHEYQAPYFLNRMFIQNGMSVAFLVSERTFWKKKSRTVFMQDGATAHTDNYSSTDLNEVFQDRRMGRRLWPARSLDL